MLDQLSRAWSQKADRRGSLEASPLSGGGGGGGRECGWNWCVMGALGMLLLVWLLRPLTPLPILSLQHHRSCLSSSLPGEPGGWGGEWWSRGVARPWAVESQRPIKARGAELRPRGRHWNSIKLSFESLVVCRVPCASLPGVGNPGGPGGDTPPFIAQASRSCKLSQLTAGVPSLTRWPSLSIL